MSASSVLSPDRDVVIPTAIERRRVEDDVLLDGLTCACGVYADDVQVEAWLVHLHTDPEPLPWCCGDCEEDAA